MKLLIVFARRELSDSERAAIEQVLGRDDATEAEVAAAAELLTTCGARQHVEGRLAKLVAESEHALQQAPVRGERLLAIARLLTDRDR